MRKIIALLVFFVISFFIPINMYAQKGAEFGLSGGASYYMGDINLYKHFYNPHFNAGGFVKYHFNSRYVLRAGAVYTSLSAADEDFNNNFQILRDRDFETSLIEISLQFELHFLPYKIADVKRYSFTPYLEVGAAGYIANSAQDIIGLALPIGFGIKKNIKPHLVVGLEWSFRRTFSDYLDSLSGEDLDNYDPNFGTPIDDANRHKQLGFRYNKDWYSMANVYISYTFKLGGITCPAYYDFK